MSFLVREANRMREGSGLSNDDFSQLIGVDPSAWSRAVNGQRPLTRGLAQAILRVYPGLRSLAEYDAIELLLGKEPAGQLEEAVVS